MLPPTLLGMELVAPNAFVNKDMSPQQRKQFSKLVPEAKKRIELFYGGVNSEPQILGCSTETCYTRIGGFKARAVAFGAFGKYKLLLSPKGLTTPLLTHEWSHAELRTRVGGFSGMRSIPHWFDEGLAVAVSEEPSHSEEVWKFIVAANMTTPRLQDLESLRGWLDASRTFGDADYASGAPRKLCVVYATAGHEVRRWQQIAGRKGLLQLIERIRAGEDFQSVYKEVESRATSYPQ